MEPTPSQIQALIREATLRDSGTAGSVVFLDGNLKLAQDNADLYWDATNERLGVGISSPTAKIHANQDSSTGAIPPLHLEQDDISEEAIRVTGTAAADVLTQTIVASAAVTTATVAGYIRLNIQDEGNQVTDSYYYLPFYTIE